jgi:hypothetical protein
MRQLRMYKRSGFLANSSGFGSARAENYNPGTSTFSGGNMASTRQCARLDVTRVESVRRISFFGAR